MLAAVVMILTLLLTYLSFGHWVIRRIPLSLSALERIVIGMILAIVILSSSIGLLGYWIGTYSFLLIIPATILGIFELKQFWHSLKETVPQTKPSIIAAVVCVVAVVSVGSTQFLSGIDRADGILYQEMHDSMWHISLGKAILTDLPPAHPADPAQTLAQYHYFFDIFLASLSYFSTLSLVVLNYQVAPLLVLSLLFATAYLLGKRLAGIWGGVALIALTAWSGSFAYMIPWFLPDNTWSESSFWVSQTFAMLVNPQVLFSFSTLYLFFLLLLPPFRSQAARHAVLIPLIATSIGFKSYGWVVLSLLYAVDLLWELLQTRKPFSLLVGVLYLVVAAPFVWLITRFSSESTFFYEPLWYINTMVEAPDRLNYIMWKFLEDHYRLKQNWSRLIEIKTKEIAVFYFGNLGIRSLFLLLLPVALFWKKIRPQNWKIISIAVIGFLFTSVFPLLFLQTGVVWNSIQFWYYALILANILVLVLLHRSFQLLPRIVVVLVVCVLTAAAVPTFIVTAQGKLASTATISHEKHALLATLTEDDVVTVCPEDTVLFKTTIVQALTPATVVVSDPVQLTLVSADQTRLEALEAVFRRKEAGSLLRFMDDTESNYVLCSTDDLKAFITSELSENGQTQTRTGENWTLFNR